MRTGHVIGIDFKLWFGQKLAVIIQQQGLADLIAIGFLCTGFDQDFTLKHPYGTIAQDLLEHLAAFAADCIVRDENRVVVMERAIPQGGASDRQGR